MTGVGVTTDRPIHVPPQMEARARSRAAHVLRLFGAAAISASDEARSRRSTSHGWLLGWCASVKKSACDMTGSPDPCGSVADRLQSGRPAGDAGRTPGAGATGDPPRL